MFKCPVCHQQLSSKQRLIYHLNHKIKPCLEEEIRSEIFGKPKFEIFNSDNSNQCQFCSKIFSRKYCLARHLKLCKVKNDVNELNENNLEEKITQLEKKIQEQVIKSLKQHTNNTNITNNNNVTNNNNTINFNFTRLEYGQEDLSMLTEDIMSKAIRKLSKGIPYLAEQIHFNPKYPQNLNIYIKNKKEPYIMNFSNNKWMLVRKRDMLENMVDTNFSLMNNFVEDHELEMDKYILRRYERFQEKLDADEGKNDIMDDCYVTILNYKDLVSESLKNSPPLKEESMPIKEIIFELR